MVDGVEDLAEVVGPGKPDRVSPYEHFGFRRIGNLRMPEGAPVQTAMWRAPHQTKVEAVTVADGLSAGSGVPAWAR